jgi:hypothetical protein
MNYVAHDCRNTRNNTCNNRWIDKDITGATTLIPTWKYCRECCEKMGIDFENQKPDDYLTEDEIKNKKDKLKKMKLAREQKIKSNVL